MKKQDYEKMQAELSALMTEEKMRSKGLNAKERRIYKTAVLACKSVLSKYDPEKGADE